MRLLLFFLSFVILGSFNVSFGQSLCGQNAYIEYLDSLTPGLKTAAENTFFTALRDSKMKTKRDQDTVYKINVVFHVVYNTDEQNINDSFVYSQLKVLNNAFRRTNPDTVNTREIFKPFAADAGIEFVLATQDPDGNPSDGIIHKKTVRQTFGSNPTNLSNSDLVKNTNVGSAPWDTDKYLNIWICDLSINGIDALLGYAYPPTGASNWAGSNSFADAERQGVVCHYKVVGENNPSSLATGSKTMVHEVGHYLGLRHIWGDGGCAVDDFMDDTPRARRASNGCNKGANTCTEVVGDELPDMLENYMDYSSDLCQNMFTHEQVAQMRANLRMFRSGIYEEQVESDDLTVALNLPDRTSLYPNPVVDGKVKVYLHEVEPNAAYSLVLYNLLGQPVYEWSLEAKNQQTVAGLLGLHGTYIYRIREDDEPIATGRLMMGE